MYKSVWIPIAIFAGSITASLEASNWSVPTIVFSNVEKNNKSPFLSYESTDGETALIWVAQHDNEYYVAGSLFNGTSWTPPETLSPMSASEPTLSAEVTREGDTFLVWTLPNKTQLNVEPAQLQNISAENSSDFPFNLKERPKDLLSSMHTILTKASDSAASGFTSNYTDPNSGIEIVDAWFQIRQINYIPETSVLVVMDVYKDYNAYMSKMTPIFYNVLPQVLVGSMSFTNWFTIAIMDEANHNMLTQALGYAEAQYAPSQD